MTAALAVAALILACHATPPGVPCEEVVRLAPVLAACLPTPVPCRVALTLARRESQCRADLVSQTGAVGLFQLRPYVVGSTRRALLNPWRNAWKAGQHVARLAREHGARWPEWYVCRSDTARAGKCEAGRRLGRVLRWPSRRERP